MPRNMLAADIVAALPTPLEAGYTSPSPSSETILTPLAEAEQRASNTSPVMRATSPPLLGKRRPSRFMPRPTLAPSASPSAVPSSSLSHPTLKDGVASHLASSSSATKHHIKYHQNHQRNQHHDQTQAKRDGEGGSQAKVKPNKEIEIGNSVPLPRASPSAFRTPKALTGESCPAIHPMTEQPTETLAPTPLSSLEIEHSYALSRDSALFDFFRGDAELTPLVDVDEARYQLQLNELGQNQSHGHIDGARHILAAEGGEKEYFAGWELSDSLFLEQGYILPPYKSAITH